MQLKKIIIVNIILILFISPLLSISVSSENGTFPTWNKDWAFRQEIILPIETKSPYAKFQPIDIHIEFSDSCWAKNEDEHSVRVCCWNGNNWIELESQIYDLEFEDSQHINKCGLVFLVPEIADGKERYFIYFDSFEKPSPNYINHVDIEDDYYYYEPISGISLEGDYYRIIEDGYGIYIVGQKGKIINRYLSQAVMKMKPKTKEFDVSNSDKVATFSFVYNIGDKDEDQLASDETLVSKEIRIDGNLMVEFGIVSESSGKEIRSTNIYKYYYCPTDNKKISVHVKHEVFNEGFVRGQENVDGAYGGLIEYQSKSMTIKRMRFGEILPFLHIYGENNKIKEYNMDPNPESEYRDWVVPYTDDCDVGEKAWISFDEGETGKVFGIIFSSNKNIVRYGSNERDGIQIKALQKEYLDILGAEIDYTGVMFGRNSFELNEEHDLRIPKDLSIEYDCELFNSQTGGYKSIIEEVTFFKELIKYRKNFEKGDGIGDKNIYTLTVVPQLSANIFYFPILANFTGLTLTDTWGELYQDGELICKSTMTKPLFGLPKIKFPKLSTGNYIVKIYRKILNFEKRIIGLRSIELEKDRTIEILCTWQKNIKINIRDQNDNRIDGIELSFYKNNKFIDKNITSNNKDFKINLPFNIVSPYVLKVYYKGFNISTIKIPRLKQKIDLTLDVYDLNIDIKDKLGFSPGVNVRPILTSSDMDIKVELEPDYLQDGKIRYKKLPTAKYKLHLSYARFSDNIIIDLPKDGNSTSMLFSAEFDLKTLVYDLRGNLLKNSEIKLDIIRDKKVIYSSISADKKVNLPPGKYTVNAYLEDKLVGFKNIDFTNDKNVNIVTEIESIIPTLVTGIFLVFIIEIFVIFLLKRFSLNTFLKLLALSLVFLSLFQPWWSLEAYNKQIDAEKISDMYIQPQAMIESIKYDGKTYLELATVPDLFTNFVGTLLIIIYAGIVLLSGSFIPNILLKRRYFILLITGSILFLTLVALAFSFGMSKICEISLGGLYGARTIDVILPNGEAVIMSSTWGLGIGFYLCILSSLILITSGFIDFLIKKKWFSKFSK